MALKIHFYIRPQKAKKNGEAPIYLRLTGDKRREASIGYSIDPHKWDKYGYRSRGKKPADHQLNQHIQSTIGAIRRIETNLLNQGEVVTVQKVLAAYQGKGIKSGPTLAAVYEDKVKRLEQTLANTEAISPRTIGR
ncbi:MAG: Arm DNA-binding domain-containing protein, partial [Bacteroidota bacterium]